MSVNYDFLVREKIRKLRVPGCHEIWFDIDEVLFRCAIFIIDTFKEQFADQLHKSSHFDSEGNWDKSYRFYEGILSSDQFWTWLVKEDLMMRTEPLPWALEILTTAQDHGFKTRFLTHRGYHPNGFAITEKQINEMDEFSDIFFDAEQDLIVIPPEVSKLSVIAAYVSRDDFNVNKHNLTLIDDQQSIIEGFDIVKEFPNSWPRVKGLWFQSEVNDAVHSDKSIGPIELLQLIEGELSHEVLRGTQRWPLT